MKKFLKKENAFTTVDIGLAIIVLIMFASIMSSMIYSLYISNTEAKRSAMALNYAVDIFEAIGDMNYVTVKAYDVLRELEYLNIDKNSVSGGDEEATAKIGTGQGAYDINLKVENPYSSDSYDRIKLITLTITYKVSAKNTQTIELQRLKIRA